MRVPCLISGWAHYALPSYAEVLGLPSSWQTQAMILAGVVGQSALLLAFGAYPGRYKPREPKFTSWEVEKKKSMIQIEC